MILTRSLESLYSETDEEKLIFPFSSDEGYLTRIKVLEKRHRLLSFIAKHLLNQTYSGKLDRLTLTQATVRVLCYFDCDDGYLETISHHDADQAAEFVTDNINFDSESSKIKTISNPDIFCNLDFTLDLGFLEQIQERSDSNQIERTGIGSDSSYLSTSALENHIRDGIRVKTENRFLYKQKRCNLSDLQAIIQEDLSIATSDFSISHKLQAVRMLRLNGMEGSKISFVNHDIFDHLLTLHCLLSKDVFQLYSKLLQRLGFPLDGKLFHREIEFFAAVNYARRQFGLLDSSSYKQQYLCEFPLTIVIRMLQENIEINNEEENNIYSEVLDYLNSLTPDMREYRLISHVLANTLLEAEELQRQYGLSLVFDVNRKKCGRFSHWDIDYLCFVCTATNALEQLSFSGVHISEIERRASLNLEQECRTLICNSITGEFFISIEDLMKKSRSTFNRDIPDEIASMIVMYPNFGTFPIFNF